ncbi:hypothetical protein K3G63_05320 [Hymenobacter sp. HSC-4F20]|nr:hypothetical protein [Hymenobacter sp. HSC-4F20]
MGGWGLSLLQLIVFEIFNISLRGQWADAVPFGVAWLAGGSYFALHRRQLNTIGKLYFGGWFLYPGLLTVAYLLDRIFFVLVSLPILVFLPNTEFYSGSACSLRAATKGFLAPPQVALVTPIGPLEKHYGTVSRDELGLNNLADITQATIIPGSSSDTISVKVISSKGKQKLSFPR